MKKISTGEESTLKTYRQIAWFLGGMEDNKATDFLDDKIKVSPNGPDEEVIADERQMIYLIMKLLHEDRKNKERLSEEA